MPKILIVEDEEDMREVLAYNLERDGHKVEQAADGLAALSKLDEMTPDLIISDIMMPEMDGLQLCAEVRARADTALTPFLFVTAKGHADDKYRGLRAGADDYITKPFDLEDLIARVNGRLARRTRMTELDESMRKTGKRLQVADDPLEMKSLRAEQERLLDALDDEGALSYQPPDPSEDALRAKVARFAERYPALAERRKTVLVGDSPAFLRIFEEIVIAAAGSDPTLIIGDTGTGKTAVAEAIWAVGDRAGGTFRTVNCSELASGDPTIASGKLFGYGKGSGLPNVPKEGQPGLLEQADGGVLFLDEVALLPTQAQSLLLLPLEGRPFHPAVGTGAERKVNIKFVMATNRDLAEQVEAGRFPRDLYERIAGEVIRLPSLDERRTDVGLLAELFLTDAATEDGRAATPILAEAALAALGRHAWPGNVRELRRVVRHAYRRVMVDERETLELDDLPEEIRGASLTTAAPRATAAVADLDVFSERERGELLALRASSFRIAPAEAILGYSNKSRTLSHRLRGMCLKALSIGEWDVDRAANLLTGSNAEQVGRVARRLRTQLDGLRARLDEPQEKLLAHLLAEHRPYAVEAVEVLRQQG